MLVCNVSLRPLGRSIAADIAEVAAALDDLGGGSGQVVFATLVDDPASVNETVDAYLGEIMLETASASEQIDGGLAYVGYIDEAGMALDTLSSTITTGVVPATWDAATVASVTLSGGDLIATNTGTTSTNQGAHIAGSGQTASKFYFELQNTADSVPGTSYGFGIATPSSTYANLGASATTGVIIYRNSGNIWSGGSSTGSSLGIFSTGLKVGIAVDLDNRQAWFRGTPTGNWNNSGTANPATNVGGVVIPAGAMMPFCIFGGTGGGANCKVTANFGATAFNGTVPSGFTSGWPA